MTEQHIDVGQVDRPALTLTGVGKTYGAQVALKPVDISFESDTVTALLGHNGAGKSTMVKVMSGVVRPDGGSITSASGAIAEGGFSTPLDAQEHGVLAVQQDVNLIRDLSVLENWSLASHFSAARMATVSWRSELRRARASLAAFGLEERVGPLLRKPAGDLKPSQRAWASLAVALLARTEVQAPALLLLDEITSAVEPKESLELIAAARRILADEAAIVVITHDIDEAMAVSDRVVVLRDGEVVADWPNRDAIREDVVSLIAGIEEPTQSTGGPPQREPGTAAVALDLPLATAEGGEALDLRHGEILGVTGLPDSGAYDLPVALATGTRTAAARVGYIPGDRALGVLAGASLTHNLTIGSLAAMRTKVGPVRLPYLSSRAERDEAARLVSELGIRAKSVDMPISELSGGNQQKALLGRWLAAKVNVLVLEEPLQGLDVGAKADFLTQVRRFVDAGGAAVYVAGDAVELTECCDRVAVMRRGEVAAVLDSLTLVGADGPSRIVEECYA